MHDPDDDTDVVLVVVTVVGILRRQLENGGKGDSDR